jgi:excisionase family DNA binding protein
MRPKSPAEPLVARQYARTVWEAGKARSFAVTASGASPNRDVLLLRYRDAAQRIGVSDRTLRGLVYGGELPSVRIGSRRLIALADLELFVQERREVSGL